MREDVFKNGRRPRQYVVVPVAQCPKAVHLQESVANGITGRIQVLAAVDLNNEPTLEAREIQNVVVKGDLTAELETHKSAIAQETPHRGFGIARGLPHPLRVDTQAWFDRLVVCDLRQ